MQATLCATALLIITAAGFMGQVIGHEIKRNNSGSPYEGYEAHVIKPQSKQHAHAVKKLSKVPGVNFWSPASKKNPVTAMIAPKAISRVQKLLKKHNVPFNITIPDVAQVLKSEKANMNDIISKKKLGSNSKVYLTRYLRYNEIVDVLRNLTQKYPGVTKVEKIGKSFEKRDMYMMRISSNLKGDKKPVVMVEAGIHAREWAAPALALHIMHQVLEKPQLYQDMDWHVIPSANPDGYEYTHVKDRLWRKTRSKVLDNGGCIGADANRNFNVHWAEVGSSGDPCQEIYHGTRAFSEVEARNVAAAAQKYHTRIRTYIALHSFGNFILYPYGHTKKLVPDWRNMDKCGRKAADAIKANGGPQFTVGNTATILYPAAAGADDYMKFKFKVPYVYTVELPGGGKGGFDLPPSDIREMVQQTFPGIQELSNCWQRK